MKSKSIIYTLLVLAVGAAVYYIFFNDQNKQLSFQTAKADKGDLRLTVTATGKLSPITTVQVGTQVSGTVASILVDFNSVVKKGQVIAEIDRTYLLASVEDAQANMEKMKIQAEQAERDLARIEGLYKEKVIPRTEYETSLANYRTAVSNLNSAQSQLNRATINLRYATIKAPIDGVVTSRSVDIGQTVAASFNTPTLFTIANDLTRMQVEANVDEADIGQVQEGQDVEFTVDAYPGEIFKGKVRQKRLQPVTTQNVVTYSVMIDVGNPDLKLLPGMTANISIIITSKSDVTKVPASALRFYPDEQTLAAMMEKMPDTVRTKMKERMEKGNQRSGNKGGNSGKRNGGMIWVKSGETIVPMRVKTGISDGSYTEILSGINSGDELITGIVKEESAAAQTQNPFVPQRPGSRGGMRR